MLWTTSHPRDKRPREGYIVAQYVGADATGPAILLNIHEC